MKTFPREHHARLLFAGDLMQHLPQVAAARTATGFDYAPSFAWVRDRFRQADVAILNFETTLSPTDRYTGYPLFRSPRALADAVADLGVDIACLANNHCCDGGLHGIRTTIGELDRCGVAHTGVFADSTDYRRHNILYFSADSIRFALVNYTYGTNGMPVPAEAIVNPIDTVRIAADLASIDPVDCVVAFLHWGDEYARRPNAHQQQLADFLHRHGVALVVGSHPHVVQPFERDSTGVTLYSLGNFVSNQRKRYTDGGLVATIDVTKSPDGRLAYSIETTPVWVLLPGYRLVPPEVGDTLTMPAAARQRYDQFREEQEEQLKMNN